jgi:ankyrin repeat protein
MSAMHLACRKNLEHMFDILMRYHPYLDCKDSSGRTPLLYCIINKNYNMCKKLLYYGASPWTEFDHILNKVKLD